MIVAIGRCGRAAVKTGIDFKGTINVVGAFEGVGTIVLQPLLAERPASEVTRFMRLELV